MNERWRDLPRRLGALVGMLVLLLGGNVPGVAAKSPARQPVSPRASVPTMAGDKSWDTRSGMPGLNGKGTSVGTAQAQTAPRTASKSSHESGFRGRRSYRPTQLRSPRGLTRTFSPI